MSDSDADMRLANPLAYDPDQDPEEKRAVRKRYRSLQRETEGAFVSHFLNWNR
jgi:hypothetical protein